MGEVYAEVLAAWNHPNIAHIFGSREVMDTENRPPIVETQTARSAVVRPWFEELKARVPTK